MIVVSHSENANNLTSDFVEGYRIFETLESENRSRRYYKEVEL